MSKLTDTRFMQALMHHSSTVAVFESELKMAREFQEQLSQPISSIQAALELLMLESKEGLSDKAQQLLTIALNNTEQLEKLIKDLNQTLPSPAISGAQADFDHATTTKNYLQTISRVQLETDFKLALQRQEFFLCYQPIVLLATGELKGVEVLVRWRHPERGLLSPTEFIPFAEETGLIIPLTRWILQSACAQLRLWHQQFPSNPLLSISINISAQHFSHPSLLKDIQQVLEQTGLDPISLKLEITESAIMQDPVAVTQVLHCLKDMDVQTYLDDFGTGYSSLAYLCQFPIDTLKIDRSFISGITADSEHLKIIRSILQMAWNLGMNVVAEGIETKDQLACLRALKCDYGQGFLFSPPANAQFFENRWLRSPFML
jgi:EAL domain-containing protein (putative c-di-GMP-specific phosphodiesterase class I)